MTRSAEERRATAWSCAYHFLLLAAYYTIRPLRDAMGLRGSVKTLPWLFGGTLAAIVAGDAAVRRARRAAAAPPLRAARLSLLRRQPGRLLRRPARHAVDDWRRASSSSGPRSSTCSPSASSGASWPIASTRAAAARRFGMIALGGTLGAMAGAGLTALLAERIGATQPDAGGGAGCSRAPSSASSASPPAPAAARARRRACRTSRSGTSSRRWCARRYLLAIAGYMLLYTITSTFAYLEQARLVQAAVHGDAARTALFARMDLCRQPRQHRPAGAR